MNKAIKWILIIVATIGILFGIILISLPFIIDPNDFKSQISTAVHEQTGRVLAIPGDITLQISPKLDVSFSLGEIQLASGKNFPDTSFASSKLAEINLAVWPLLTKKQLQISKITLSGVQLNLIRNIDGKTNWDDLAGGKKTSNAKTPGNEQDKKEKSAKKALPAIDIGAIHINDINVQYKDQQAKKTIALNNFNLSIGHLQENTPFPVSADFNFKLDDSKQPVLASIKTGFDLSFNLPNQHFNINDFSLDGLFEGKMFPSAKLEINLQADIDISIPEEKVTLHKLTIQQNDFTAETALSLTGFKTPAVKGTFKINEYSPRKHLTQLGITLPEFNNNEALTRLSADFGFSLNSNQLEVKNLQIQFDDTMVKADASVKNLQQPAYVLDLRIDQLDLDRYGIKKDKKDNKAPAVKKNGSKQAQEKQPVTIPVHLLRGLTFNSDITIKTLKAAKLTLTEVTVKAGGKDGLIQLQPLSAQLYEGNLKVTGQIDARPDIPEMKLKKSLQGVQLGPLFVDMVGKEELSGRADINADIVTKGIDNAELTRNSNGKLTLSLSDGKIAKLQILQTIRLAKSLLSKETLTSNATSQPTGFALLTASGTLTNGVFRNDDLVAASDLMKVTGKGKVDLVQNYIDYLLTVNLTDRIERKEETGLVALGNTPIPYRIKGNLNELHQSAALEDLVKTKAKEVLLDTLEKQFGGDKDENEKSETDANSLIKQGLKGLFGN
jgi:AsmA protein